MKRVEGERVCLPFYLIENQFRSINYISLFKLKTLYALHLDLSWFSSDNLVI